jgi:hypothetical protein
MQKITEHRANSSIDVTWRFQGKGTATIYTKLINSRRAYLVPDFSTVAAGGVGGAAGRAGFIQQE